MAESWPRLVYGDWRETAATLHMWTQVVGKVRMVHTPWINHSWHVTLYVSPRGLTTSLIPYGSRSFEIRFDFIDHRLCIEASDGARRSLPLEPQATAEFYARVMAALGELGLGTRIHTKPNEVARPIAFDEDHEHASYDRDAAHRFWTALSRADHVFRDFRSRFVGKSSPSHFFWGSFDLAVTRFSGRAAPSHPGGIPNLPDAVTREAYSHEVSSAGFWPGGDEMPEAIFYAYAYPTPEGYDRQEVRPTAAAWNDALKEFVLPYEAVRSAADPEGVLAEFMQSTYEAAARLGAWDRKALERSFEERPR